MGEKVLVDTRNIRLLASTKQHEKRKVKLLPRFMGPFKIVKRVTRLLIVYDFRSI